MKPPTTNAAKNSHAIVMGASMAGLMAARALSDHFDRVTLIERDTLPTGLDNRRGVPQGRHTHGLLASGREVWERQFPGITSEMLAAGAVPLDVVRDCRWFFEGAPLARPQTGLDGVLATRAFMEGFVRRRTLALPNVALFEDRHVEGLIPTTRRDAIAGIRLSTKEEIFADLIVDATGRGSRTPQWLEGLGYPRPKEEKIEVSLAYTTRFFRRRPADLDGDASTVIPPTPTGKRGGVMLAQEGDRWTVTLIGYFGNVAPGELAGFVEYARSLPSPDIYNVIRHAEPLGDPASARFACSQRRRYEALSRFPARYLVIGDGVCSFNPIYGQGMSVAALESLELDAALREGSTNLARRFFRRIARLADIPWSIAAGSDLRMPETVGPRNPMVSLVNAYMARLHRAAQYDAGLSRSFHRVANLLAPPATLFHPATLRKVLFGRRPKPTSVCAAVAPAQTPTNLN